MSAHTPGPWTVHQRPSAPIEYGHHVTTGDGLQICKVTYQLPASVDGVVTEVARIANARLIAAAPELLGALKAVMRLDLKGHQLQDRLQFSDVGRELLIKVLSAIAKATGETA